MLVVVRAQAQQQSVNDAYVVGFQSVDSADFKRRIQTQCSNARVVGLGEVSHFTRECYLLKQAAIEALIETGYSALILEVDFGQALIWDRFVTHGEGDLHEITASTGWFTYRTEEFKQLLARIRKHNTTAKKPFRIFGMEMTAIDDNLDWLVKFLQRNVSGSESLVDQIGRIEKRIVFQQHEPTDLRRTWNLYWALREFFDTEHAQLVEKAGSEELKIAERIMEILRQYATYASQDDASLKAEIRDQFSFRNVLWVLDALGPDSRAIIWAHNGHIARERTDESRYDVLGHYLSSLFDESYVSIGFTFNSGEFGAFSTEGFQRFNFGKADEQSLTHQMSLRRKDFILFDIRGAKRDGALPKPYSSTSRIRTNIAENHHPDFARYMDINLAKTYDMLLYIEEISCPRALPWLRD